MFRDEGRAMKDRIMLFSVLRYTPSRISGEYINLGVLYSDIEGKRVKFSYTKKKRRLEEFDDQLDFKQVNNLLVSIQKEVIEQQGTNEFSIEKFTKYYINSYCFSNVQQIVYDSFDEKVNQLDRTFLRFDYEKSERSTQYDDERLLKDMLTARQIPFSKSKIVTGSFNDKITYDFVTEDFYIKYFDFDGKQLNKVVNSIKTWAWNSMHSDKKIYIIFRYSDEKIRSEESFNTIIQILKEANVKTYNIDDVEQIFNAS